MRTAHVQRVLAAHVLLWLTGLGAEVAAEPRVFRGATLHPASSPPLENADLVIDEGRIVAVGSRGTIQIPADAVIENVAGKVIIPGLVDTHSHVGLYPLPAVPANQDGNEASSPVTPEVRALDSIWPGDPRIRMALAGGITTANVMPGSGNAVGGQTAYLKLRGDRVDDMLVRDRDGEPVLGGMKMANGENPKRANPKQAPMTRMGVAFLQRKLFVEAEGHRKKDGKDGPDLRLDPMVEVLEGRRIVQHHTHRADDILTVLRLADEFGHRVVIQHGTEAHLVAAELTARDVPVSTIVVEAPGGKLEARELDYHHPALLEAAGVRVAIHTDDMITPSRLFLRSAALAVRGGMSEAGALRAVTLEAARMLDLGDQLGSLEPGKDADLVILSGPPFSVWTRVLETWIDGELVWDADDADDLRFQTGGYLLGDTHPAAGTR
jgi:imidazolonepropionase-like amidohydrolase